MSFSVFVAHISCLFYVLVIFFLYVVLLPLYSLFFFFNDTATTEIYTLSLHDALPISARPSGARIPRAEGPRRAATPRGYCRRPAAEGAARRRRGRYGKAPRRAARSSFLPQACTQLHHSIAQAALRGLAADAGRHGDFLDRQFAFLLQEKGFALRIGKRGERGEQALHRALAVEQQVGGDFPVGKVLEEGLAFLVTQERRTAFRAVEIHQAVVGDRVDPGSEFRAGFVAPAGIEGAHPKVREQFFRGSRVADLPQQEPVQGEAMAQVEQLEGAGIAPAVAQHQLLVARLAPHRAQVYRFARAPVLRRDRAGSRNGQDRREG